MRLKRSKPNLAGINRVRRGKGFAYYDPNGVKVSNQQTLERINNLSIPPAWNDVWICPFDNGHLQAIGTDKDGRQQYLYHLKWQQSQASKKFAHMLSFAEHLPLLRDKVATDLLLDDYSKQQICAVATRLLDRGFFRIGSESYAQSHGTYGIATVKKEHLKLDHDDQISFEFPAKHGINWRQTISDQDIFPALQTLQRRRTGDDELLAFRNPNGEWQDLKSQDINSYIDSELDELHFTAKDFRTWHATVLASMGLGFVELVDGLPPTEALAQKQIAKVVREVSYYLHNTPAVCRSSYIDPQVWDRFKDGVTIAGALEKAQTLASIQDPIVQTAIEKATYQLLTGKERRSITRSASQILANYE